MSRASELQSLSALRRKSYRETDAYLVYKACVAVANNGVTLSEEEELNIEEKSLLEVRRRLFRGEFPSAQDMLDKLEKIQMNHFFEGDRLFLMGQVMHRQGIQKEAARYMSLAGDQYAIDGDFHRELRARVNGALCLSTLESCLIGELNAFEQEARRLNFMDIASNICRTRATELLKANRAREAYHQAMESSHLYLLDGYQDDRSVSLILAAICQLLLGNRSKAFEARSQAFIVDGKVGIYFQAYESLLQGKKPKIPVGHSLYNIDWKEMIIKAESIPGRIIGALQKGPCSRNDLILAVWGPEATDVSYCNRLYTAILFLRKDKKMDIRFDGQNYELFT
jgi:hypothetical protein